MGRPPVPLLPVQFSSFDQGMRCKAEWRVTRPSLRIEDGGKEQQAYGGEDHIVAGE
jgi:hypothetical protein